MACRRGQETGFWSGFGGRMSPVERMEGARVCTRQGHNETPHLNPLRPRRGEVASRGLGSPLGARRREGVERRTAETLRQAQGGNRGYWRRADPRFAAKALRGGLSPSSRAATAERRDTYTTGITPYNSERRRAGRVNGMAG
jgi:hypothetical protein